jgi:hypothetical protein
VFFDPFKKGIEHSRKDFLLGRNLKSVSPEKQVRTELCVGKGFKEVVVLLL